MRTINFMVVKQLDFVKWNWHAESSIWKKVVPKEAVISTISLPKCDKRKIKLSWYHHQVDLNDGGATMNRCSVIENEDMHDANLTWSFTKTSMLLAWLNNGSWQLTVLKTWMCNNMTLTVWLMTWYWWDKSRPLTWRGKILDKSSLLMTSVINKMNFWLVR